jgi:hypothetical protein
LKEKQMEEEALGGQMAGSVGGQHEKGRDQETTVPVAKLAGLVVQAVRMIGEEWEEERLEVAGAGIVQGRKE